MVGRAARCTCRTAGRRREQVFYPWRYTLNRAASAAIANWRGSQVLTARLKRFDERLRIRGQFARRVRRNKRLTNPLLPGMTRSRQRHYRVDVVVGDEDARLR